MLRCEHCGGHAHAGLAHLHGLLIHLCQDCTRRVLVAKKEEEAISHFKDSLTRLAASLIVKKTKRFFGPYVEQRA